MSDVKWRYNLRYLGAYSSDSLQKMFDKQGEDGWEFVSTINIGSGISASSFAVFKKALNAR